MVSIRGFSFALVFVLVLIGNSTAHRHVMETTVAADHGSGVESATENLANSGKGILENTNILFVYVCNRN
ncbi:hypothetical protein GOBAR_DD04861 [Gossypium barbadense]|nr:hypothetical protein GOBAR_DD04861 [Gossypium barbadense]